MTTSGDTIISVEDVRRALLGYEEQARAERDYAKEHSSDFAVDYWRGRVDMCMILLGLLK